MRNEDIIMAVRLWKLLQQEKHIRTAADDPNRVGYVYETGENCRTLIFESIF